MGTIFPQMQASFNLLDASTARTNGELLWLLFTGVAILVGTAATLIYFHFGARAVHESTPRRAPWIEALAWVGQIFIAITLGSIFAGVYAASLTAFVERLYFMRNIIFSLFS